MAETLLELNTLDAKPYGVLGACAVKLDLKSSETVSDISTS